jgi:diacylglycerol kinase (ATP)
VTQAAPDTLDGVTGVYLLTNLHAGSGRSDVAATLGARGMTAITLVADKASEVPGLIEQALNEGATRFIVAGGDGTVHTAVGALERQRAAVTVGIVPVGTGNDIASALGLPTALDAAVSVALGDGSPIDLIRTGGAPIVSVATLGFSVDVNERANRMSWPRGAVRYNIATVRELPALHTRPIRLTVDGQVHDLDVTFLAVGNTPMFGGGMRICPEADPTDGLLDVTVIGPIGRLELLRVFPRVFKGTHGNHRSVSMFRGKTITVEERGTATSGVALWGDGEPVALLPNTLHTERSTFLLAGVHSLQAGD